jgi:hypothetical protein
LVILLQLLFLPAVEPQIAWKRIDHSLLYVQDVKNTKEKAFHFQAELLYPKLWWLLLLGTIFTLPR